MTTLTFDDDPLLAGTPVKATHLAQIVTAVNQLRATAGLPALGLDAAAGQPMRAADIIAVREAINEARVALEVPPVAFSPDLATGSPIRTWHIQDLREALR